MKIKISSALQLGAHFKSLRRAKGWSQNDLGKRLGITQSRIAQIESNPESISVDKLIQILHVLDAGLLLEVERNKSFATNLLSPLGKQKMEPTIAMNSSFDKKIKIVKEASVHPNTSRASNKSTSAYRDSDSGRFVMKASAVKAPKTTKW